MADASITRFRRWYAYERDAHAKVLASLETVPPERRNQAEYNRAINILAHVIAARRMWLSRLGIIPPIAGPLFPENVSLERIVADSQEVERLWVEYLATLDDEALGRSFEYKSIDAGRFRNQIEDILAQLAGHSWYHRGQIAMLVRASGGEPAITDLIFWCREPIGEA
jgi:uncharacterized damage-inducible protein DinB